MKAAPLVKFVHHFAVDTESYLIAEKQAAERLVVRVRVAVLAALLVVQVALMLAGVADARSAAAGFIAAGFGIAYALGAWIWIRSGYDPRLAYVTTLLDVFTVSLFAAASAAHPVEATKTPGLLLLFAIVAIAGLRQSPAAVLFSGLASAAGLLALLGWVALVDPAHVSAEVRVDFLGPYASVPRVVTEAAIVLVAAGITAATSRRTSRLVGRAVEASVRRQSLLAAMERYFPEREALQMIAEGQELRRGGERRTVTVLHSDIRGFTTLSEELEADQVVALLNDYFEAMVAAVFAEEGTLISFVGDGMWAVFGLPKARPDDAARALRAARAMLSALTELNRRPAFAAVGGLRIGIAIHTGEVLAGSIGSPQRVEYTVIGDTVNTAARLEELNKRFGTSLLLSEAAVAAAGAREGLTDRGSLRLRGKNRTLRVFEVGGQGVDS